jgi:hypothetical protein
VRSEASASSGVLDVRARGDYMEMPGLSLTLVQAQRLWGLDRRTCTQVMTKLVQDGFLRQRPDGSYVRRGARPSGVGHREV